MLLSTMKDSFGGVGLMGFWKRMTPTSGSSGTVSATWLYFAPCPLKQKLNSFLFSTDHL
jgi:hypothetical protein